MAISDDAMAGMPLGGGCCDRRRGIIPILAPVGIDLARPMYRNKR